MFCLLTEAPRRAAVVSVPPAAGATVSVEELVATTSAERGVATGFGLLAPEGCGATWPYTKQEQTRAAMGGISLRRNRCRDTDDFILFGGRGCLAAAMTEMVRRGVEVRLS